MIIYLDNCSFNRPFDNQKQIRIRIETEAKLYIQEQIIKGKLQLAWSYILDFENAANPFLERKETINNWKKYAVADTAETENIISAAEELFIKGIKSKDALHVACAIELNCEYFITTDREIIKKLTNFEPIKVISPVDFINYI
jgi:predicted nucleic acid-binding protein